MEQTIFAILTSEHARSISVIEASLDHEFIAGAPWFNKIPVELLDTNVEPAQ